MTKVLIVEDDKWLAEAEALALKTAGFETDITFNALDALAYIDESSTLPDVIILDILLTGSTAFALLNELRSYEDTNATPIILCTNLAEQFSLDSLKQYGVHRIIDKSTMQPSDLVASVRSVTL